MAAAPVACRQHLACTCEAPNGAVQPEPLHHMQISAETEYAHPLPECSCAEVGIPVHRGEPITDGASVCERWHIITPDFACFSCHLCAEVGNPVHPGELVIDGATLSHILGTPAEELLAACGARCGSVVICRSSPAQKAAIVRMMAEYEMRQVCTCWSWTDGQTIHP